MADTPKPPKRPRGRPPGSGKGPTFLVSLPKDHHGYLEYLAGIKRLGTSVPLVAEHILVRELDKMLRDGYHLKQVPRAPDESSG